MRNSRAAGWIGGTAVLVLIILVATWFLLASPKLDAAAATVEQAESISAQNQVIKAQNVKLAADFAKLDDYKAELVQLQTQIPTTAQLSAYTQGVHDLAAEHGVFVVEMVPGNPAPVVLPAAVVAAGAAPAPAATEAPAAETPASATGADEAPAPAAPEPDELKGSVAVPLQVKVVGTYANVSAFLNAIQTVPERLFLATALEATRQDAQAAAAGKPEIAAGDVELLITGYLYVLQQPLGSEGTAVQPPQEGHKAPVLPPSDRNPFARLAGTEIVTSG